MHMIQSQRHKIRITGFAVSALFFGVFGIADAAVTYTQPYSDQTVSTSSASADYPQVHLRGIAGDVSMIQIDTPPSNPVTAISLYSCPTDSPACTSTGTFLATFSPDQYSGLIRNYVGATTTLSDASTYMLIFSHSGVSDYFFSQTSHYEQSVYFGSAHVQYDEYASFDITLFGTPQPISAFFVAQPPPTCSLTALGSCISEVFEWAFSPSDESLDAFSSLTLASSSPFGYMYDFPTMIDSIYNATGTPFALTMDFTDFQATLSAISSTTLGTTSVAVFDTCWVRTKSYGYYDSLILPMIKWSLWFSFLLSMYLLAHRIF